MSSVERQQKENSKIQFFIVKQINASSFLMMTRAKKLRNSLNNINKRQQKNM
jgi:hypothetical protein